MSEARGELIPLADGQLRFWKGLYATPAYAGLQDMLRATLPWRADRIRIAGQWRDIPRLQAWFGDPGCDYRYSGVTLAPHPWTPALTHLREDLQRLAGQPFNSVLANLYRGNADSMGWHADDEPELGRDPVIASLSFGSARRFRLRRNDNHRQVFELELGHGDLLVMEGALQHHWQHSIPKERLACGERINLTFRDLKPRTGGQQVKGAKL
jgi:alkylated DNA repair dioxygenase AlkB